MHLSIFVFIGLLELFLNTSSCQLNEMLPCSIHWVACGTCYRKSEGTELCGIEIQHSSLWRITNKREARNIGFWADMLIIFKFPHNFLAPQVCPLSIWQLCNTKLHWSQALLSGVSVRMGDQNNKPIIKNRSIWPKILLTLLYAKQILMKKQITIDTQFQGG